MLQRFLQPGVKKGESLVEVIMAIFIISVGASVATSLIVSALQSNAFSRDNLIALNLAVEGMEAMRSIRDANWLKFSYDKPNCWNISPNPPVTVCDDPLAKKIDKPRYTVDLDMTSNQYGWSLTDRTSDAPLALDNPTGNDNYRLFYYDINTEVNSDGVAGADDDKDILASVSSSISPSTQKKLPDGSRFYRVITLDYPSSQEMNVTSTVQWVSQNVKHEVVLTSKLTDYQKVKVK